MKQWTDKRIKLDKHSVGCALAYIYIFTSYIAQDILISSSLNSLFLYAFLLSSAYIFFSKMKLYKNTIDFAVWYFLFMVFSALLVLRIPDMSEVFDSFYAMIVSFLVALSLQLHVKSQEKFRAMCRCYAISAVAFVLLLLVTGNLEGDAENRLGQELLGNANIFASMMMVGAMYTVWIIVYDAEKSTSKLWWCIILALDLYALMLSGGRKFFIVPFVFLYILLWFKKDKEGRKHIFMYTVLFAALVLIVWTMIMRIPALYNAIGVRMEGLIENFSGGEGDASAEIREKLRGLALGKWLEKPIFGYGFDSFKYFAMQEVGHFYYSHCNYTELLYCGGIFYLALYYWFYFRLLNRCFKEKNIPTAYKAFVVAAVISLAVFDYGAVSYNSTTQVCMLMMANSAANLKLQPEKGEV